jgi:phosphatidylserine decarboxylase
MRIHKEGLKVIPVAFILLAVLYAFLYWLIPIQAIQITLGIAGVIFFILIVRFFRDPEVITPEKEDVIYAPCDGKVVVIEKTLEDEYLKEERIQLSIFMSPLNVHVNRSPVKGIVDFFKYHPGKYLVAWHPKSSSLNERTSIGFETDRGIKILMRQIAGAVARRIAFYPKVGEMVIQGSSVGFIRFGSRVDLFLPLDTQIDVSIGDLTTAGTTIIGKLQAK